MTLPTVTNLCSILGNVGPHLNSSANVFISSDAGISWRKVNMIRQLWLLLYLTIVFIKSLNIN